MSSRTTAGGAATLAPRRALAPISPEPLEALGVGRVRTSGKWIRAVDAFTAQASTELRLEMQRLDGERCAAHRKDVSLRRAQRSPHEGRRNERRKRLTPHIGRDAAHRARVRSGEGVEKGLSRARAEFGAPGVWPRRSDDEPNLAQAVQEAGLVGECLDCRRELGQQHDHDVHDVHHKVADSFPQLNLAIEHDSIDHEDGHKQGDRVAPEGQLLNRPAGATVPCNDHHRPHHDGHDEQGAAHDVRKREREVDLGVEVGGVDGDRREDIWRAVADREQRHARHVRREAQHH